jgi:curved DNA-binding protein CbpA
MSAGHQKMTIRRACAVMGFPNPPVDKKPLKKAFQTLTKEYHPDQQGPKASADKMIELTEAYRLLRGLIEQRVGGSGRRSHVSAQQPPTSSPADAEAQLGGAGFQSAGFGASSDGMWLPWQREPNSTTTKKHDEEVLAGSSARVDMAIKGPGGGAASFQQYVAAVRDAESRLHEARRRSQQASAGTHGFDATHMEQQRRLRKGDRSWFTTSAQTVGDVAVARRTPLPMLAWRYTFQRVQQFPRKMLSSVKYIVLGR